MFKKCKVCGISKLFNKLAGQNKKASGFMGRVCWQCAQEDNTIRNRLRYSNKLEECRAYHAAIKVHRRNTMPLVALIDAVRSRMHAAFKYKGYTKRSRTQEYLGATFKEVQIYLENKFTEGMTWDNYGTWHIDHITPLISAKSINELEALFHYTNLQPLWAVDNLKKGSKINVQN